MLLDRAILQAAAEYGGITSIMSQVLVAGQRAMHWSKDHWLAIIVVLIAFVFLSGLFQRKA